MYGWGDWRAVQIDACPLSNGTFANSEQIGVTDRSPGAWALWAVQGVAGQQGAGRARGQPGRVCTRPDCIRYLDFFYRL